MWICEKGKTCDDDCEGCKNHIEVRPVVHSLWHKLRETKLRKEVECPRCQWAIEFRKDGPIQFDLLPYCPACGATMDKGVKK